jgi:glycosyltransferase involved in cell wall biosynthesis
MENAISVVIPSYNSATYLPDAVESALNQTVAPLEVIVVDDGSTDATADVLERYRGRIVAISQENRGLSAARNRGIEAARGGLIAFLDADDIWLPQKLEKQLACLEENPQAPLVHSDMWNWDEATGVKTRLYNGRRVHSGRCYAQFFFLPGIRPSTWLIRRDCLERFGGFDETIRRPTTQDYDLCFRIARHHEIAYVDEPLILYRLHGSNSSKRVLEMSEDILLVLQRAIRADPALKQSIGRERVVERLFELSFEIAYTHHNAGRGAEARRYLLQALRQRPLYGHAWLLYLVNFLPSPWVRTLRRSKASLSSILRRRENQGLEAH